MIQIELTLSEIMVASQVGIMRQVEDLKAKKKSYVGEQQNYAWQRHIEGALSECAMAKYLNVYWSKSPWPNPDVGDIEVRSTPRLDGPLIIRPGDKDDTKYYLLTGINGKYIIRGYIYAKDGKQDKWLTDNGNGRPKAYFVPQTELRTD